MYDPVNNAPEPSENAIFARRIARRLLRGMGSAIITPYVLSPGTPGILVAHALTPDGKILVAACPQESSALGALSPGEKTAVRMDISLQSHVVNAQVDIASIHFLADLRWEVEESVEELFAQISQWNELNRLDADRTVDELEELMAVAAAPGGRLGLLEAEQVVVHDINGISRQNMELVVGTQPLCAQNCPVQCLENSWSAQQCQEAQEIVNGRGELILYSLCDGVDNGIISGAVCSKKSTLNGTENIWGSVLCVDADAHGITLMRVLPFETTVYSLKFAVPLMGISRLEQYLLDSIFKPLSVEHC